MAQHARPVGPTTNAAAGFSPEMVTGYAPDRPIRYESRNRAGQSLSQTTPVSAPIGAEMLAGWRPVAAIRPALPFTRGSIVASADAPVFSIEMVQGWQPTRSRLFSPPKLGWQLSQPSPVAAPILPEMWQGWTPSVPVRCLPFGQGSLSIPPDVLTFSVEMVQDLRPTRARLFLAPRLPLPVSQATPTATAFSQEMITGSHPDQPRRHVIGKAGGTTNQLTVVVFTPEMFAGWQPARSRAFLAPRIGLPLSQTTHVVAPFSPEMAAGSRPETRRKPQRGAVGWYGGDVISTIAEAFKAFWAAAWNGILGRWQ